jgi:hypothetical protein
MSGRNPHGDLTVPLLGTTWQRRGLAYWLRRLLIVLGFSLPGVILAAILSAFLWGIYTQSRIGFVVVALVFLAIVVGTGWRSWWQTKHPSAERDIRQLKIFSAIWPIVGISTVVFAFVAPTVAKDIVLSSFVIFALIFTGPMLVLVISRCGPETPEERELKATLDL